MNARDSILARLRATTISELPALPDVESWFDVNCRRDDPSTRMQRLRTALEASRAEVLVCTRAGWPELLLRIAATKQVRSLLVGADTPHGAALEARRPDSLQLLRYQHPVASWREVLFEQVDASLTLARSAIADSGSLVLWPSAAEPRLMSLVPPVHFVLLEASHIHSDLLSAMQAEAWTNGMPTNALLISGPSKTADIQQTMAYGAHGPRELVVLMLQGDPA